MMRIAVIAPPWLPVPPPAYGGTELVLDGLCRGLAAAGHDVLLCTTGDSTCPVERSWTYERCVGVEWASPAAELRHVMDAYAAAADWQADVVHDHTLTGLVWSSRHPDLPVVTTNHGPFDGDLGAVYRRTAATVPVIAISLHQASTAGGIPVEAVIHHSVDASDFDVGHGGEYALFLGRMTPDKGVHTAIHVARRAGLPLRIAAKMREQPERDYFDAEVRPLLGGDIEYVGEVGGAVKHELLTGARCLLNPIAWPEPFGMVMIEALASGTPVVSTRCGSAPEIIDEGVTGFLCDDEHELVAGVAGAASLDAMACRKAAEERFSLERLAAEHLTVYERVAARGMGAALVGGVGVPA